MAIDLWQEYYLDDDQIAILISEVVDHLPLLKFNVQKKKKDSVIINVLNDDKEKQKIRIPGLYFIYERKIIIPDCLYVGKSDLSNTIHTRLYRWGIEMLGIEKDYDQKHSAAAKARKDGITTSDHLYVKYLSWDDIDNIMPKIEKRYSRNILDEKIARIIKPRYNVRGL